MSLLETAGAQELLAEAEVTAGQVRGCQKRLTKFLERYLPCFYRKEQRFNAGVVIRGLLSDMERKTCEPVAYREKRTRKPIQFFVGSGLWDDEAVMSELRGHVVGDLADPGGVLVLDPSAFPKKGTESCGVKRQWCGRLGKVENCQLGVFMAYVTEKGYGPLDRRLFLPKEWAKDGARRKKCHVPRKAVYRTAWQIGRDMVARHGGSVPHSWVTGDAEFGRPEAFRAWLRSRGERYVLDVPSNTLVRDLGGRRPPRRRAGEGRRCEVPFVGAAEWAKRLAPSRWERVTVRDGHKGQLAVEAAEAWVRTKQDGRVGTTERLVVIRTVAGEPRTWYVLTDADHSIETIVRVHAARHRIEQVFQEAKGEVGLAHYEVRSWVGWHHHMTLALLAMWFVRTEAVRLGGKSAGRDGAADPAHLLGAAS
jgi:SRSO17 transposase